MSRSLHLITRRGPITALLLAGLAIAALTLAPAHARAAGRPASGTQLSLVSPANNSSTRVQTRTLVVRLRSAGPSFRASLNGRNVTARFGQPVRGVRTARFTRGGDFTLGRGSFMAAVGRRGSPAVRTVGFSFTAWRRDPRPLVFHRRPRERAGGGDMSALTIDVVSDAHVTGKRIWVNGKPIRDHLLGPGDRSRPIAHGCGCHLDIGANHGLRFGPNRVTVEYAHRGWTFQRTTRIFRMARTAPLAGAGQDQFVTRGNPAALSAASSMPARPGDRLEYRWRIASRPHGGHARLIGSHRMRARLIGRKPGAYRVSLQVTETGPRSDAAAASASSAGAPVPLQPVGPGAPVPLQPVGATAVDDVDVGVGPTSDPMGVPIHTIASSGAIQVGPKSYPMQAGAWMQILVLNQTYVDHAVSDTFYTPQQLAQAKTRIDNLTTADHDLVIVSVPSAQNLVYPTRWAPKVKANFDYKDFQSLVSAIGGVAVSPDGWSTLSNEHFSIIGQKGTPPGQAWQSSGQHAAAGSPQAGSGNLDGYLQLVSGNAYSYVSPQYLPIDTEAQGSDGYTHNVITVGNQTFGSTTISNGDTGAQLVVLDATGARPLAQVTYTLIKGGGGAVDGSAGNPATGNYGAGVRGLASTLQYFDRTTPSEALVILQTFGQGQWYGNTPNGSPSWANDNVNAQDLRSWNGSAFVKNDGTDNPNNALYSVWNPGYPTVAGQVGTLTSGAGHDVVAGFGAGQDNNGTPNGGLTVVASTHPYNGRQNFVQGQTGQVKSNPRVVGTLTRTRQGQWHVETASDSPAFAPSELWETAFAAPQPWPYTTPGLAPDGSTVTPAEAQQYQAADSYIAGQLWRNQGITDVRSQYVPKKSDDWEDTARVTQTLPYPTNGSSLDFTQPEFSTLQQQLATEMGYVQQIKNLVENNWEQIFRQSEFNGYVNLQGIAREVIDNAKANDERFQKETTDLDWLDIGDYSLEVGSSIIGFTPLAEAAEPMGLLANVLGLASASMGSENNKGGSRFDSEAIWDRSDQLGADLVQRMNKTIGTLNHIEDLFLGNWAKLKRAGQNASGAWAYGTRVQTLMKQSLAVTTTQEFYEALLPLTYQQWVIDPNATGATDDPKWGPNARTLPGRGYRCWGAGDDPYPSPPKTHPFSKSPDGALSYAGIHGYNAPGSTTAPAAANQSWYSLRVLKSVQNPMQVVKDFYRGNNPTIWHSGSNPPSALVNGLFEPIDTADDSGLPTQLGLYKTTFFGDYDNGWGWRKAVCS